MRRMLSLALLTAVLLLPAGAASAGAGGGHCPGFGEGATVALLDNCFAATAHFLEEGTSLRVVNEGYVAHTYTAVDGSFDTGPIAPGESAELTVGRGVHRVYCTLHSSADGGGMAGVVVVEPSAGTAPVGAASAATGVALGAGAGTTTALAAAALVVSLAALATARRRAPVT